MKRNVAVLIAVLALVGASAALWWPTRVPSAPATSSLRRNVVLITVDTLRADRLRRGFTPSIDALADAGMRFDNARTTVPLTLPAHTTILTGTLPAVHGVHDNGVVFKPGPKTIARVLKDAGYRTGAFVGAFVLNRVFGLGDGFDTYDDRVRRDPNLGAQLEAERPGGDVVDAAIAWLGNTASPFFLWVHLYDPHAPYNPPPEYLAKAGGRAYDGEVAYADAQVGRVISALRDRGQIGSTLIAVAGDHGEGLGDHGERTHGMLVYDSTLRVPLVVLMPNQTQPHIVADPISLSSLAGILLEAAHVGPLPQGMGRFPLPPNERDAYSETQYPRSAGWHALTALADDRWKLILSSEAELYDLSVDPLETRNVASDRISLVDGMRKRAYALRASTTARVGAEVSPEAVERLRALGYVGGSGTAPSDEAGAANPARFIDAWTRFEIALSDVTAGNARGALPVLADLAGAFPSARVFQATYARALKDTGGARAAVKIYTAAVARWPTDATLYHDLAVAARAAGDRAEAMRAEQAALAIDRDSPSASNGLGLLQAESGAAADAAASFERAATGDPSNAWYWTNLGNARRELGALDEADAAYRRALDADASFGDALNGLGVLLVQRKRPAEAVALFARALAQAPALHEARLNLGIAYQESGNLAKAAETYRELVRSAPRGSREAQAAATLLKGMKSSG